MQGITQPAPPLPARGLARVLAQPGQAPALGPALRLLRRAPLIGPVLTRATLVRRYRAETGRSPRLDHPTSFDDRMLHRMLHDHDPRLKVVNDKLAVREMVARLAGPEFVVPLLGVWEDPARIAWDSLPERFVLKASHASGRVAMVERPEERDPLALTAQARGWLATDYFDASLEWGYRGLPRRILAEPLLVGAGGMTPPPELQVFIFGGRAALYRIQVGRKGMGGRGDAWFALDGSRLELLVGKALPDTEPTRAEALTAIAAAERVAAGFVQMRVDFYITATRLLIGELTPYHRAGRSRWRPPEWNDRLGAMWGEAAARMAKETRDAAH